MEKGCKTCRFSARYNGGISKCPDEPPRCNHSYHKWQPKEDTVEYRVLKEISPTTLGNHSTSCGDFWREFYSLMGVFDGGWFRACPSVDIHPVFDQIIKWAEEDPKRIDWLIKQGFVEKVEPELIPLLCPFCGHRGMNKPVIQSETYKFYYVSCSHCHARGPVSHTKHEAIKAWNRRT